MHTKVNSKIAQNLLRNSSRDFIAKECGSVASKFTRIEPPAWIAKFGKWWSVEVYHKHRSKWKNIDVLITQDMLQASCKRVFKATEVQCCIGKGRHS